MRMRNTNSEIQRQKNLNRIGQPPELTASAIDHNIDLICRQEHRYMHSKDIKYHDTGNG